jgi:uncharacterized integral membrane protein (TIGR00697 family)
MFDQGITTEEHPKYKWRREMVFVLLAGIFLGSLAMLNILGISRLIDLSFYFFGNKVTFQIFIGVLAYPITFLCTDFISELYGKRRANMVVWVGLGLNLWVLFILWLGSVLPPNDHVNPETGLPSMEATDWAFFKIKQLTFGATAASMIAYLTAQFVDVSVFHALKKLTKGKMLWVRNNGSTLTSQMVDSIAVVSITYYVNAFKIPDGSTVIGFLTMLILSNYIFKMSSALLDTIPFYIGTKFLGKYLNINPLEGFSENKEE